MSVELTIETVTETIVLELQDHVPAVITIDHIPDLRDELDSKVDKVTGLGLSELSFTTADKSSLDQSELDRHTHSNKAVIDDLSDDAGVLQYKGLPISDQAALDAKVDKVAGKSLVDDTEIAKLLTVQADATKNATDAELRDRATHTGEQAISTVTDLQGELDSKVDKETGKSLVSDLEIAKLATVQENATANRPDVQNADKVHGHVISDIDTLAAKLELINQWLQVPADKKYFDFVGNRYSSNGAPAPLSSLGSTFTRLSSATQWKDGALVDVAANVMRLDKIKGLLIEPQRTNLFYPSEFKDGSNVTATTMAVGGRSVDAAQFTSGSTAYANFGAALTDGVIHSSSFYVQMDDGLIPTFSASVSGASTDFALTINGVAQSENLLISQESSSQYRVKGPHLVTFPLRGSGVMKYSSNSARGFKTSMRQIEVGGLSSTYIKTTSKVETRAKETLVVPFIAGQTVTADKDAGVTMTITGTNAVFEGHGYIRNVRVN